MDLRVVFLLPLLLCCAQIRAEESGSILFIDAPNQQFLRTHSSDGVAETSSMSLSDVSAALSVLLGFSPPASLSADSSSKLNEVLSPNPFNRPRAVIMLQLNGIKADQQLLMDPIVDAQVGTAIRSKVPFDSSAIEIQLPGKDEVSVISLDESLGLECNVACINKQLQDLTSLLGGSYVSNAGETLNGEFTVSLASGKSFNLHLQEKADRDFVTSIIALVHNIKKAMEVHEDFSKRANSPAELLIGSFSGFKALEERYGDDDDVSQQGMELFHTVLKKLFASLQETYKGQIVEVLYYNEKPHVEFASMSNVKVTSRPSRLLEEMVNSSDISKIVEVLLVRRVLAWTTGIILLISTILGIYYLLSMPLTRDTLLYSNVKLD